MKLHYRFGSREVIDLLHANGYIASYDEVLRFRKSAAIMTGESEYAHRDLVNDSGLISCWCDNFDLQVYTPNGCRETHAMAIEFVQHTDKTENPPHPPVAIPRISQEVFNSVKVRALSAVEFCHFKGSSKPIPPRMNNHYGLSLDLVTKTMTSLNAALQADIAWLVSMHCRTEADIPQAEWSGSMFSSARESGVQPGGATRFVFGPLTDSPPTHPDTMLTTLTWIDSEMRQENTPYIPVSADMAIYKLIMQIKWSQPDRWKWMVVRPGGMHTIMSFIGCIGVLMDSTGLEEILGAAFNGVSNMLNGKRGQRRPED